MAGEHGQLEGVGNGACGEDACFGEFLPNPFAPVAGGHNLAHDLLTANFRLARGLFLLADAFAVGCVIHQPSPRTGQPQGRHEPAQVSLL